MFGYICLTLCRGRQIKTRLLLLYPLMPPPCGGINSQPRAIPACTVSNGCICAACGCFHKNWLSQSCFTCQLVFSGGISHFSHFSSLALTVVFFTLQNGSTSLCMAVTDSRLEVVVSAGVRFAPLSNQANLCTPVPPATMSTSLPKKLLEKPPLLLLWVQRRSAE